jgi:hypothetical protein
VPPGASTWVSLAVAEPLVKQRTWLDGSQPSLSRCHALTVTASLSIELM